MATIAPLNFTKDWTDPSDFPAVEPDEARARADMQELHNQTREYINGTLVPAIPSGVTEKDLAMLGYRVTGLGAPEEDDDAATKEYVDDAVKSIRTTATITSAWTGSSVPYTQTISIAGVTATSIVEVSLSAVATAAQAAAYSALLLQDGGQAVGSITLRCFGTQNTVSIPINVIIRRD